MAVQELTTSRESLKAALDELTHAQEASREDHKRRRGEATIEAVRIFESSSRKYHASLLKMARDASAAAKEIDPRAKPVRIVDLTRGKRSPEVIRELRYWLDELELLAVGARYGLYDARVVHRSSRSMVRFLWDDIASTYVHDFRQGDVDKRKEQPTAYENSQWLADQFPRLEGRTQPETLPGALPLSD